MQYTEQNLADYFSDDLATKYKRTGFDSTSVDPDALQHSLKQLEKNGYVVIENVLSKQDLDTIRNETAPFLKQCGRNNFEGDKTQRIYSVIAKTMACNGLVEHPLILALLDNIFSPNYLLSQLQVINILGNEAQQPLHYDEAFYNIPRPHKPLGAATVWAIDDFTAENGSTMVIPQSHLWGDKTPTEGDIQQQIPCVMPAGSVVFFLGTLWHGGGENKTDQSRLAVTAQYCEGFCRSQENFSLSIPPERVAQVSDNLKHLLGYSIYGPFMGMVNGQHPKRLLEPYL